MTRVKTNDFAVQTILVKFVYAWRDTRYRYRQCHSRNPP